MRLEIFHETRCGYRPAPRAARHLAYLTPRNDGGQRLISSRIEIRPGAAERSHAIDVYGNDRLLFALRGAHEELVVTATSRVETPPLLFPAFDPPWEAVRDAVATGVAHPQAVDFVFGSPLAPCDPAFGDWASPSFVAGRGLLEAARDLAHRVHTGFEYGSGATDVDTPAIAALAALRGVCQDFAHVMIAALRTLGLAARYVSGYVLSGTQADGSRFIGDEASHAWIELFVPHEGAGRWIGIDPTNDILAGESHARLAVGRDYADVAPLSGIIEGGGGDGQTLAVAVSVREWTGDNEAWDRAPDAMTRTSSLSI